MNKRFAFLILIFILIFFFYLAKEHNSVSANIPLPEVCRSEILLVSDNSTVTLFKDPVKTLNFTISNLSSGKYYLKILLFRDDRIFAESKPVPFTLSYFTKVKVNYLKFDYIK
jgi:hypothetical protein